MSKYVVSDEMIEEFQSMERRLHALEDIVKLLTDSLFKSSMPGVRYTKEDDRAILDMIKEGRSYGDIERLLHRPCGSVATRYRKLKALGVR